MTEERMDPRAAAAATGKPRRRYVTDLFNRLAPRYDAINILISLGQTTLWRRRALGRLALAPGARVLDVGTGTGWVVRFMRGRHPDGAVEGMDLSPGMLCEACRRDPAGAYFEGDAAAIPRPDGAYDLVTAVFTTRNFHDLDRALDEMVRVLRPGGRLVVLDTFLPGGPAAWRVVNRLWLERVVPLMVAPFADRDSFAYLAASIRTHVSPAALVLRLAALGCAPVTVDHYSLGSATCITAVKT